YYLVLISNTFPTTLVQNNFSGWRLGQGNDHHPESWSARHHGQIPAKPAPRSHFRRFLHLCPPPARFGQGTNVTVDLVFHEERIGLETQDLTRPRCGFQGYLG